MCFREKYTLDVFGYKLVLFVLLYIFVGFAFYTCYHICLVLFFLVKMSGFKKEMHPSMHDEKD